jgi:hypothetical protein
LVFSGLDSGTITIKEWFMTEDEKADQVNAHQTSCMLEGAPAELDAGSIMALKVKVSCSSACDLRGKTARIIAQDAVVKEIEAELTEFDGVVTETDEFVVKAPTKPGEYTWASVFPAQEKEGVLHEESSAPFSFIVKSHTSSMTVWDVPSPIVLGTKFKLKVGVRCSAECKLTDSQIEIYDHESSKVGTEALRNVPWPDTAGLYWAEVELEAPGTEGYYRWTAKLPTTDLKVPHEEGSHNFSFTTSRPPEHVVTVEVMDKDKKGPIMKALVTLIPRDTVYAPYRKRTDHRGVAGLYVPKGEYQLCVDKGDYKPFETTAEVAGDTKVTVELKYSPSDPAGDRPR